MYKVKLTIIGIFVGVLLAGISSIANAQSVPEYFVYEGRLLNSSGNAITTAHEFRFSFWSSSDAIPTDILVDGSINLGSANYGGWQESQVVTPNSDGFFSFELGRVTPLPQIDSNIHKYLQVEVKQSASLDTSYELLDPTGDNGADTIDRRMLGSVPYAFQSENSSRSLNETFIVDYDNTIEGAGVGEIKLQFGQTLNRYLSYDYVGGYFNFNDDVRIDGNLDVTGTISGFSNRGTLNNGDSLTVNHPSDINNYFTAIALKYIQSTGLIDSRLDYDTSDEGNFVQENAATGTDFISNEVRLSDSGGGVSTHSYPYTNSANFTYDSAKIDVTGGLAQLKQTPNWGNVFSYYKMDSNWDDSSDNSNDATANGGPSFNVTDYKVGTASGTFDGSNDYIQLNPATSFPTSEISVEFWMKTSDTTKNGSPFSYAIASQNNEFLIFNYRGFSIYIRGSGRGTGVSANDGNWHHIVVTWRSSDGQLIVYKDGIAAYTGAHAAGTPLTSGGSMIIGQEQDNVGGGFDVSQAFLGQLDEYVVYNKVISAADVLDRYNTGLGKILAKYPMDHPSIRPSSNLTPASITSWTNLSETYGGGNAGSVCYNLSDDNGATWKYWNGGSWATGGNDSNCNTNTIINSNISTFDTTPTSLLYRAFLISNGYQKVEIDDNTVSYSTSSYPTAQNYYVSTNDSSQLNSTTWERINLVTIDDVTPVGTNAVYLVSFDDRLTWKYWDGSAWQIAVDTGAAGSLSDVAAFTNANTDGVIEGLSSANWESAGGFDAGTTVTFDVAVDFGTTNSANSPSLTQISVNYDEIGIWQKIQGTDADNYPIEFISPTQTRVTNNSGSTEQIQLFVR